MHFWAVYWLHLEVMGVYVLHTGLAQQLSQRVRQPEPHELQHLVLQLHETLAGGGKCQRVGG